MENIFDPQHAGILLACLITAVCLNFLAKLGEIGLDAYNKSKEISARDIEVLKTMFSSIERRLVAIERDMNDVTKLRKDLNVYFRALEKTAGPKWAKIIAETKNESLP